MDFYDKTGSPIAYSEDGEHIYTFDGQAVAYLNGGSLYAYSGKHLGRLEDGLVRDSHGGVVLFTEDARGGPAKPVRRVRPVKGVKRVRPVKGVRQVKPSRPADSLSWSAMSVETFFG